MSSGTKRRKVGCNKNEEIQNTPHLLEGVCNFDYSQVVEFCETRESNDENDIPMETNSKEQSGTLTETSHPKRCHLCDKSYRGKKSLASHMRLKHRETLRVKAKMPCLEENCDFNGSRITSLISHLIRAHGKKFQCEKVTFQSQDAFWKWKKQTEDTCRASYSANTSAKELVFGDKKIFFRCSRSGYSRSCSTNVRASRETKINMKINAVCTSFMNVSLQKEGGVAVFFCKTHYGHKDDNFPRYSRLTSLERNLMKSLLLDGLTASEIVAFMKTQLPEHRHHLLKHSKVRNLAAKDHLHLNKQKGCLDGKTSTEKELTSPGHKSADFLMDMKVENEVEIKTDCVDLGGCNSNTESQNDNCRSQQNPDLSVVDKLRSDITAKVQQISRLAVGIVSKESLSALNINLDSILKGIRNNELIEVVADTAESNKNEQKSIIMEDIDGNEVYLLCSDKDVHELTQ